MIRHDERLKKEPKERHLPDDAAQQAATVKV